MITVSIESLLNGQLPQQYYAAAHGLYLIKDGLKVLYVGKAEKQSIRERFLQHLAADTQSAYHLQANGPSALGNYILDHAPASNTWPVDLLTLHDCHQLLQLNTARLTLGQAEKLIIEKYAPILNEINNPSPHAQSLAKPSTDQFERSSGQSGPEQQQAFTPPQALPKYSLQYLASTSRNEKTQATYRYALLSFQKFAETTKLTASAVPLKPEHYQREILAQFLVWLKASGLKNNSIRTFIAVIKQFLYWLQAENLLPPHVRAEEIRLSLEQQAGPHLASLPPEHRHADEAVARLLSYYSNLLKDYSANTPRGRRQRLAYLRNHAILQTLYSTAGRASEVAALTRAQVISTLAEDQDQYPLLPIEVNGNGAKRRLIYLTLEAQAAIKDYLRARAQITPVASRPHAAEVTEDALFVRHDRDDVSLAVSTKTIWLIVQDAAKAVFGCDAQGHPLKRVGPQQFRHLRAQHLYDAGMDLNTLQTMLGHSNALTTRKVYAGHSSAAQLGQELKQYGRDPT